MVRFAHHCILSWASVNTCPSRQFWDCCRWKSDSLWNFSIAGCQWTVNCLLGFPLDKVLGHYWAPLYHYLPCFAHGQNCSCFPSPDIDLKPAWVADELCSMGSINFNLNWQQFLCQCAESEQGKHIINEYKKSPTKKESIDIVLKSGLLG